MREKDIKQREKDAAKKRAAEAANRQANYNLQQQELTQLKDLVALKEAEQQELERLKGLVKEKEVEQAKEAEALAKLKKANGKYDTFERCKNCGDTLEECGKNGGRWVYE